MLSRDPEMCQNAVLLLGFYKLCITLKGQDGRAAGWSVVISTSLPVPEPMGKLMAGPFQS